MPFKSQIMALKAQELVKPAMGWRKLGGRHYDLMLVSLIVAVIALMVLPLPPIMLDTLIALNLTISVTLLIVALYIDSPLGLSTFPSLLLFTTLFRLSLNIASTRQILLHAFAGDIILTFGKMVVGGDVIIGIVIFLIIAIVQFIVIAKGSERVAEVAARFSLDAMPGKQMSIDADLRAGIINKDDARKRRQLLESESQLYGAMDGAMKFVKGDAIAGMVIAAVNILAGVIVGMLRKDMSLDAALHTYSVLAIGDALVSQIPSLFVSVASGIVITRVARHEGRAPTHLGNEIAGQIRAHPKALLITGIVVTALMMVPGFPKLQFLVLGGVVAFSGWNLFPGRSRKGGNASQAPMPSMQRDGSEIVPTFLDNTDYPLTLPIVFQVYSQIDQDVDPTLLDQHLAKVKRYVTMQLGMPFPGIVFRPGARQKPGQFGLYINEIPVSSGTLKRGAVLSLENDRQLQKAGIPFSQGEGMFGSPGLWVDEKYVSRLTQQKMRFMPPEQIFEHYALRAVSQYAREFMGIQETQFLLRRLESQYPDLEKELRQQVPVPRLADVLRRLIQEGISIRDLRLIAQTLIELAPKEKDNGLLTEYVRNAMARYITYNYTMADGALPAMILAPAFEDQIKEYLKQSGSGSVLMLPETMRQSVVSQIQQIMQGPNADPALLSSAVLLVNSIELRPHMRTLIMGDFINLAVLAAPQLEEGIRVISLGQIQ